jgi:hypothetical protein
MDNSFLRTIYQLIHVFSSTITLTMYTETSNRTYRTSFYLHKNDAPLSGGELILT